MKNSVLAPIVVMVGLVYVFTRSFGKYIGARVSATMTGCAEEVKKYLGITLLPQAGVALGMSALAFQLMNNNDGLLVRNITLFGVLIYELLGPTLTKIALTKAGDIKEKPAGSDERWRKEELKKAKKNRNKR